MGISTIFKLGLLGILISIVPLYFRYNDPSKLDCKAVELPAPPALVGPLKENSLLAQVDYILKDKIDGPESIVAEGQILYTTLYDGRIVKIEMGKITKSVKLNKETNCGNYDSEPRCGRPLGIRRFTKEQFVVVDAYLGIFLVDIEKGTHQQIYKSTTPIGGQVPRFLNDVDIINEDELIVSDSSVKWDRRHAVHVVMENAGDGRVFHYKISTKTATVLMDGLHFSNGVQVHPDKESVLVAETGMARIVRYYFTGAKKGQKQVFAENLPGMPDNIRLSKKNTLWVGMAGVRYQGGRSFLDQFAKLPEIRQFLIDVIPARWWIQMMPVVRPPHSLVVQLDLDGKIISSLHDPTGEHVNDISQVTDSDTHLFFGSFHSKYIARLPIDSFFGDTYN